MDKQCTYHMEVLNGLDEVEFNASAPLIIKVVKMNPQATQCQVVTDQAGLIGLMRHLHAQGFIILSLRRQP